MDDTSDDERIDPRSSYRPEYAAQAEKVCRLGATDVELADFFNISERTLYRWKTRYPEFLAALTSGKEYADNLVEHALYGRATGYSHPDVHVTQYQGVITVTPIVKHYPPDTVACIFWLKNRKSAEWRDRVEHTGKDGEALEPQYSGTELARRIALLLDPRFEMTPAPTKVEKAPH